jgi:hypothetical protein
MVESARIFLRKETLLDITVRIGMGCGFATLLIPIPALLPIVFLLVVPLVILNVLMLQIVQPPIMALRKKAMRRAVII